MTTRLYLLLHRQVMCWSLVLLVIVLVLVTDVLAFAVPKSPSIQRQIKRATKQFNESKTENPEKLNDIQEELAKGIVKPCFHNLVFPEPILGNRRSYAEVKAGEADLERTLEFDYYSRNLDEVSVAVALQRVF